MGGNTCCSFLFGCHLTATHFGHYNDEAASSTHTRTWIDLWKFYLKSTYFTNRDRENHQERMERGTAGVGTGLRGDDNQPEKILRSITCSLWASSSSSASASTAFSRPDQTRPDTTDQHFLHKNPPRRVDFTLKGN